MSMDDIYSPENIARSRARAAAIRADVQDGSLEASWLNVADEVDDYANEREADARRRAEGNL